MSDHDVSIRSLRAAAVLCATACLAAPSSAGSVRVEVHDCRSDVQLTAHEAPLSEVLDRLAEALRFRVHRDGVADRIVTVDLSAPGPELVAALAAEHGNFLIRHATDARCGGQRRVAVLWLTPHAASPGGRARPANAKAGPAVVAVTETATPARLREVEDESRRRKLEYDIYVRRHGTAPPGEPEDAAKP